MNNKVTRHIPNTFTCLNLFFGCVATVMAFEANYKAALICIILSALLDFCDGLLARMLHAYSPLGKELDSLADDISFGLAPAMMAGTLLHELSYPPFMQPIAAYIPYLAFFIAIFSALRLAKFNVDARQTTSFIGLPVPANALFWGSLIAGAHPFLVSGQYTALYLLVLIALSSWILVSEIPMFSLKFKTFSWKDNKLQFVFLFGCLVLMLGLQVLGFAACVVWYIILSLVSRKKS